MKKIKLSAPAKINLFLEILGKRPDNYHNLNTLFAKVEVFDKLTITALKSRKNITLQVTNNCGGKLPPAKDNIVLKAARKFKEEFHFESGLNIKLEKNIPIGAGLGGGSSDAASTLIGLCEIAKVASNPVRNKRLLKIAGELGADVSFFLYRDTFCTAKSTGEDLFPLHIKKMPVYVIIAYPGFSILTRNVYKNLKLPSEKQMLTKLDMLNKLKEDLETGVSLSKWKHRLFNRLGSAVLPFNKKMNGLYKYLDKLSGGASLMSGSGSSIFALTQDKKKAQYIAKNAQKKAKIVFNTCFLGGN